MVFSALSATPLRTLRLKAFSPRVSRVAEHEAKFAHARYCPALTTTAAPTAELSHTPSSISIQSWAAVLLVFAMIYSGAILIAGLWTSRSLPFVSDISTVLGPHNLAEDTLSMSHILDLTGQSFAALRLPAALAAFALLIGPVLALWFTLKRKPFAAAWSTALAMVLFLAAAHIALGRFDPYLSSRNLAGRIAQESSPGDEIAIYGDQAFGSSLLFYLRRPIDLVNGRTTSMWFGSTYPDAPRIFLDDGDLLRDWDSTRRVFLFVPPHQRARVDSLIPNGKFVVAESSGKIIYSNR
jgi:hypothetical protein